MKPISIGVFALILVLAITSPLKKEDVVVENFVQTIEVTITVWVTPGQTSHAPTPSLVQKQADNSQARGPIEVPPIFSTTSLPSTSPRTCSTPASIAAYIAPTTTSTFTTPSPVFASVAAAAATAPASAPNQAPGTSNASGSGACGQIGGICSGDLTVYDTTAGLSPEVFQKSGFGSCGWLNNGTYENVFALAHGESPIQPPSSLHHPTHSSTGMMGDQSNGNPYCGRMATITFNGKVATGKLVDKCPGCDGQSIDLSYHLFAALGATTNTGRYHNVKWSFTT